VRSVEADGVGVSWLNHSVLGAVVTVALQICAFLLIRITSLSLGPSAGR
jgi:hypothetical protein